MKINKSILRIFEVRARAGKVEILRQKLSDTSISVVQGEPGNLGYFFGENISSDENDLVFISVWKDLQAVKSRFGKDWEQSYLPEGYEPLIESCSIKHLEVDGNLFSPDQHSD